MEIIKENDLNNETDGENRQMMMEMEGEYSQESAK